jgi:hypothetical protein
VRTIDSRAGDEVLKAEGNLRFAGRNAHRDVAERTILDEPVLMPTYATSIHWQGWQIDGAKKDGLGDVCEVELMAEFAPGSLLLWFPTNHFAKTLPIFL